ncbi:MAG: hypothetical protein KC912_22185 [Proteobacteria bacterium]|nr:hypothetical protein [Pseudomonadota bacterium]
MTRPLALTLALAACQPPGELAADPATCMVDAPEEGLVTVQSWMCRDQVPLAGEGDRGDTILANAWMRVVVRQPAHALTVPSIGGGTLVDATIWGFRDRLHEAIPLVDGGWLELDTYTLTEDGVRMAGEVRPLPGRSAAPGRGEVSWRLDQDTSRLHLEGANGLWLHATSDQQPRDGRLQGPAMTYVTDGTVLEDLGGAVIFDAVTTLDIVRTDRLWEDTPGAIHVSGTTDGTTLELATAGQTEHRLTVWDGVIDAWVPPEIDAVRVTSPTGAPSAWVAPGADLDLPVGPAGTLVVSGDGTIPIRWIADGRGGIDRVSAGTTLDVGAGTITGITGDHPLRAGVPFTVEVPPNGEVVLQAADPVDTGHWVLANLDLPAGRDHTIRRASHGGSQIAAASSIDAVVLTAVNDVGDGADAAAIGVSGSVLANPAGWTVTAWPWRPTRRRMAHGALDPELVTIDDAVAAARGGPTQDRVTVVDRGWLEVHGPLEAEDVHPDGTRLWPPLSAPLTEWQAWLAVDPLPKPVGPLTWVWVPDPSNYAFLDLQRALGAGATVASSGPLLTIQVAGETPLSPLQDVPTLVEVSLSGEGLDHVALTDGNVLLHQWDAPLPASATFEVDAARVLAVGWSDDGAHWAATSALRRPVED